MGQPTRHLVNIFIDEGEPVRDEEEDTYEECAELVVECDGFSESIKLGVSGYRLKNMSLEQIIRLVIEKVTE